MNGKKQKKISSSFSLPEDQYERLEEYAKRKSLSKSSVIRLLILEHLDTTSNIVNN
jgi:predicted DNA-binding protein